MFSSAEWWVSARSVCTGSTRTCNTAGWSGGTTGGRTSTTSSGPPGTQPWGSSPHTLSEGGLSVNRYKEDNIGTGATLLIWYWFCYHCYFYIHILIITTDNKLWRKWDLPGWVCLTCLCYVKTLVTGGAGLEQAGAVIFNLTQLTPRLDWKYAKHLHWN